MEAILHYSRVMKCASPFRPLERTLIPFGKQTTTNISMELTGKSIIGNPFSGSGKSFKAENPSTGKAIEPSFYEASQQEVKSAGEKADAAFALYSKKSGKEKAAFLEAIADEIVALGDILIKKCMEETG